MTPRMAAGVAEITEAPGVRSLTLPSRSLCYHRIMELSLAPGFLIAMPQLGDPNFSRTVVLMLHHTPEGSMGLVVNRRIDMLLASFCEQHEFAYGGPDDSYLHFGGPCELHRG